MRIGIGGHCFQIHREIAGVERLQLGIDFLLLLDVVLPRPDLSYRATLEQWVGLPLTPPTGAARERAGKTTVYASWNGATAVSHWLVQAGPRRDALQPVGIARRRGFETVIPAHYATFPIIDQTADKFLAEMKGAKTKVLVPERGVAVTL